MQYQIVSNKNDELMQLFHHTCEKNGIVHDNRKIFEYLSTFETKCDNVQLSLFDKDFAGKSPNGIKKTVVLATEFLRARQNISGLTAV